MFCFHAPLCTHTHTQSKNWDTKVNALVIGGQGCLGKRLIQTLIQDGGYRVHSLDLYIPPKPEQIPGVHAYIQTDITRRNDVLKALEGIESVFMTASLQPCVQVSDEMMWKVNLGGAQNVVEACKLKGVRRLLYTSSVSVTMGKNPKQPHDLITESQPFPEVPLNSYVATKGKAELLVRGANNFNRLKTCALRIAGLMGGKNNLSVSFFMNPFVVGCGGDGMYNIDFIDIDAVVDGHILTEKKLHLEQNEETQVKGLVESNGVGRNGIHREADSKAPKPSIGGKVYNLTMRDKCSHKEMAAFIAKERGLPMIRIPLYAILLFIYLNHYFYKLTGIAISPASVSHYEFLVAFNFLPDLANKDLGWSYEKPWQYMVQKAIKEY